jgi:hypothetical protein
VEKTAVTDAVRRHVVTTIALEVAARSAWVAQPAVNNASVRVQSIRIIGLQSGDPGDRATHSARQHSAAAATACRGHLQSCDPRLF